MARKVFLSVLGAGFYGKCIYEKQCESGKFESDYTRFIQCATVRYINDKIQKWQKGDVVYILLTDKAINTNWKVDNNKRINSKDVYEEYIGLEEELNRFQYPCEIIGKRIKDGKDEKEIWKIFESLYEIVKEGDELYLDITHAFRYIPMFLMVFSNYVKFMKGCMTRSITYGNYEAKYMDGNTLKSPIVDITSFSDLQDWTSALNEFRTNGSVEKLSNLYLPQSTQRLTLTIKKKGETDANIKAYVEKKNTADAKCLKEFIDSVVRFKNLLITCQGKQILEGSSFNDYKKKLEAVKSVDKPQPFNHLIDELEQSFKKFSDSENVKNGLVAAEWCYDNGLYQQSITLLEETIISLICEKASLNWREQSYRELVSSALHINKLKLEKNDESWIIPKAALQLDNPKEILRKILELSIIGEISTDFGEIADLRNEYNHAAMLDNVKYTSDSLKKNIKIYIDKYKS